MYIWCECSSLTLNLWCRHSRALAGDMFGVDAPPRAPSMAVPAHHHQQKQQIQLWPVCEHPGKMHAVTAVTTCNVTDCTKFTEAEVEWMGLVKKVLTKSINLTTKTTADLPTVAWGGSARADEPTIAASLRAVHTNAGSPLHWVWRPDSSVPRWVCGIHKTTYY